MSKNLLIINCMLAISFVTGCDWIPTAQYKRQVNLTIPAGQAKNFAAKTHNGDITIKGSETTDCNLTAAITVKADTEENAKTIAEQVKIEMVSDANNINVKIEKPENLDNVQICVELNAAIPAGLNLSLGTHNGNIRIDGIMGNVKASTHNGDITTVGAAGRADLTTHNGNIDYKGVPTNLKAETHNGNMDIKCIAASPAPCEFSIGTHNGNIDFTAPANFSAAVDGSTDNGSIHTTLPLTISGEKHNKVNGVIGDSRDKLHLKTHNGSINIK